MLDQWETETFQMEPPYFDWQAHLFASDRPSDDKFSLQHLLNIIPTDIPKNASEFDEELRDLIISLYSDSVVAGETDESNKATLSDDDISAPYDLTKLRSQPLEGPNDDGKKPVLSNIIGYSLQENSSEMRREIGKQTEPDLQNASHSMNASRVTSFERIDHDEVSLTEGTQLEGGDVNQNDGNSLDQSDIRAKESFKKPVQLSQSSLIRYEQDQIQIAHGNNNDMQNIRNGRQSKAELCVENEIGNEKFCPSKLTRYEKDDIEIEYSNGGRDVGSERGRVIGSEYEKAVGAADFEETVGKPKSREHRAANHRKKCRTAAAPSSLPENQLFTPESSVQSGENPRFETADDMYGTKLPVYNNLHTTESLIGSTQLYQENLDQLGDGEAARIFTNVSSWLSRFSSESPRELLSTVSLMSDLPSGNYFEAENETKERENTGMSLGDVEVEDQCSNTDEPSHLCKVMKSIRPHTLSVISEESVVVDRQIPYQTEEDFSLGIDIETAIVDPYDSGINSGVSSVATMNNAVDVQGNQSKSSITDHPYVGSDASVMNDASDILGDQSKSLINDKNDQPDYDNDPGLCSMLTSNDTEDAIDDQLKSSTVDQSDRRHDPDVCSEGTPRNTKDLLCGSGTDVYLVIANGSKDQQDDQPKASIIDQSGQDFCEHSIDTQKYMLDDQMKSSVACQLDSSDDTDLFPTKSVNEPVDNQPKASIFDLTAGGQDSVVCSFATLHDMNSGLNNGTGISQRSSLDVLVDNDDLLQTPDVTQKTFSALPRDSCSSEYQKEPVFKEKENLSEESDCSSFLEDFEYQLHKFTPVSPRRKDDRSLSTNMSKQFKLQVERLSSDYAVLVKDKIALQKSIWELEERLVVEKKSSEINEEERMKVESERMEMETLISDLEKKLDGLASENNRKEDKLKETIENLAKMDRLVEDLKRKAENSESKLIAKSKEIEMRKTELDECIASTNVMTKDKEKCELQLKLISEAFKKLKQSKDWLEFQLKTLGESRTKMELQFEETKAERNEKSKAVIQLQEENKRLSTRIVEANYSNVAEKKEILKEMERVESEMMEHRLYYCEVEDRNETLTKLSVEQRDIISMHEGKIKELIDLIALAEETTRDLKSEVAAKEDALNKLISELDYCKLRVEELQRLLEDSNEDKSVLVQKINKSESEICDLKYKLASRDDQIHSLVNEKEDLKTAVNVATIEKTEFENAARALKTDMQKIDLIFQVMKRDLASKSSMLQNIDAKKIELVKEMKDLQQYLVEQDKIQNQLRTSLKENLAIIRELQGEKDELLDEVKQMKDKCSVLQSKLDLVIKERTDLQEASLNAEREWIGERCVLQETIGSLIEAKESLLKAGANANEEIINLKQQNESISEDIVNLRKEKQIEIANLRAKENRLSAKIKEKQNEWIQKEENYESSILSLVSKLKDEIFSRQTVEKEFAEQGSRLMLQNNRQKVLVTKLKDFANSVQRLKEDKKVLGRDFLQFKTTNSKLLSILGDFVTRLNKTIENSENENESLLTEVNALRSELMKSEKSMQFLHKEYQIEIERARVLEKDLMEKQDDMKNVQRTSIELKKDRDLLNLKFNEYKQTAEKKLSGVQTQRTELINQLDNTKEENNRLLNLCKEMEDRVIVLQNEAKRNEETIRELEESLKREAASKEDIIDEKRRIESGYNELQGTIFSLENQLSIEKSHGKVIEDQIRNLKWQNKQATAEAQTRKEEIEFMESQHATELQNVTSMLSVAKTEVDSLRSELSEVRKDKQKCSGQLIEARERLKRQGSQYEKLQTDVKRRNDELLRLKEDLADCKSAAVREMLDFIVKKAVVSLPDQETKKEQGTRDCAALDTLRKCMSGLRVEMDSLHSEMFNQMENLQDSKVMLQDFQESLGDLHSACDNLHQKSTSSSSIAVEK